MSIVVSDSPSPSELAVITLGSPVAVDLATTRQSMFGFGTSLRLWDDPHVANTGVVVFPQAQRDQILSQLYADLNLTMLRPVIETEGVEPVNDNADPFTFNSAGFNFAWKATDGLISDYVKPAFPLGLKYWFPVCLGDIPSFLNTSNPDEFVELALAILIRWRELGVEPPYFSVFNEPSSGVFFIPGGNWPTSWFSYVTKNLGIRMRALGIQTMLIIPDDIRPGDAYPKAADILADPTIRQYVGAVCYHNYGGSPTDQLAMKTLAESYGMPLWYTEQQDPAFEGYSGSIFFASFLHNNFSLYGISAFMPLWGFFGSWEGPNGSRLIDVVFSVSGGVATYVSHTRLPMYYALGHFSKFILEGDRRVDVVSGNASVLVSAFIGHGKLTIIAVNNSGSAQAIGVACAPRAGSKPATSMTVFQTTASTPWQTLAAIPATEGHFNAILPASSITTFQADIQPAPSVIDTLTPGESVAFQFGAVVGPPTPQAQDQIRDDVVAGEFVALSFSTRQIVVSDDGQPIDVVSLQFTGPVRVSDVLVPTDQVSLQLTGPAGPVTIAIFDSRIPTDAAHIGGALLLNPPDTQGGGGCSDPADLWRPAWLIDLSSITPTPAGYTAAELRFSSVDIDALTPAYQGRLVDPPTVDRKLVDVFWGVTDIAEMQFTLANADGYLTNLFLLSDLREKPVIIQRYDIASGVIADTVNGRIASIGLENGKFILRVVSIAVTLSEQLVPSKLITAAQFPKAVDLQEAIPVIFGNPIQMRCPYINDDTLQNEYDYIVGYGTLTVAKLYRNGPNNTMVTISTPEYTVSATLYPGYTVVRFPERQVDFNNEFHRIYADVVGTSRNFADAIRDILTNATWGLGQSVDVISFTAAATALDNLSSMFCDGVLATQRQAQDTLRQLLIVRGMRLGFNALGEWTLTVDQIPTTIMMIVRDGPGDGERNIVTSGPRTLAQSQDAVSNYVVRYRPDFPNNAAFQFSQTRSVNAFGKEKVFESLFLRDHTAADHVCDYLAKREKYGQDTCELELAQEARRLIEGNLVQVDYAPVGYTNTIVEVREVSKTLETVRVKVASWNADIYQYQAGTLPTDTPPPSGPISTLTPPTSPTEIGLFSDHFIDTDGQVQVFLDIGWAENPETDIQGYEIQFKRSTDAIWTSRQAGTT